MKNIICIFSLLFVAMCCRAQPNSDFEHWSSVYGSLTPDGWQTLNFLTMTSPPNPRSVFRASGVDAHSGTYAMKLTTIYVSTNPIPQFVDDTMGAAFTGKVNISSGTYNYGFPYSDRPQRLEFWAKYLPVGNDSAGVRIILRKWNGVKTDTIAEGELVFLEKLNYTLFKADLTYFSNAVPDTGIIFFASSRHSSLARVNSTLYVDDIVFTGSVGIENQNFLTDKVKVYPNPAKDNLTIQVEIKEADNIEITDISGKIIGIYKIESTKLNVNTALYMQGTYFYAVRDQKNRIVTKGKFNVVK